MSKKLLKKFRPPAFGTILVLLLISFYFLSISGYYLNLKIEHFVLALIIFSVLAGLTIGWQAKEKRVRKAILFLILLLPIIFVLIITFYFFKEFE